jgi:hypothetical protein
LFGAFDLIIVDLRVAPSGSPKYTTKGRDGRDGKTRISLVAADGVTPRAGRPAAPRQRRSVWSFVLVVDGGEK